MTVRATTSVTDDVVALIDRDELIDLALEICNIDSSVPHEAEVAEHIYQVVWDPERKRVDAAATAQRRAGERHARIARGRPYEEFEAEWLQRKPPEEILTWYGSWPDAKRLEPLMRP